ncbi:25983_t:CDS:2, partial [Dentiscutata erythropus]
FPTYYTWTAKCKWTPRQTSTAMLARLYIIQPSEKERYYLRSLLIHAKGATNFDDLKTINSHLCGSFKEACFLLGFLQDDAEWDTCLLDAKEKSYNITELENKLSQNVPLLNEDQCAIFNAITQAIEREERDKSYSIIPSTENTIELPSNIVIAGGKLLDLIDFVYSNFTQHSTNTDYLIERTILTPKNDDASKISDLIIDQFPGEVHTYLSADFVDSHEDTDLRQSHLYLPEFLRS